MSDPDIVRIGVTGHRFLAEVGRIESGIDQALKEIRRSFPAVRYQIFSSLAMGADQLVAKMAMEVLQAELVAVLPIAADLYEEDFKAPKPRSDFHSLLRKSAAAVVVEAADKMEGYAAAGSYVVEHSDVMIAIWDGLTAQGDGGAGDIVEEARRLQKPLFIVAAGNRKPGTEEPTSLGAEQGKLRVERAPSV